ncbi:1852_t:CDS:2 [Funneliformis geosporum]|uniref:8411_t:CDS:1 n=1 Tax=Funneliformis geosporum TaxID=1117311 RepID=A0A9W4SLY9_9GLOM|nr:1852_t:CDS:2 [Funneliformis geosporum]CAI2174156.1 8411_t:CDS:2 [Funneliformis geosporum]
MSNSNQMEIDGKITHSCEKTIILNIGGIKYETFASTLTAHPTTYLGNLFEIHRSSLNATKGNEYFFDRNGYAFRYILEWYRTGKILLSIGTDDSKKAYITREELMEELEYFQIPMENLKDRYDKNFINNATLIHRLAAEKVDEFISALEELIREAMSQFLSFIELRFYKKNRYMKEFWAKSESIGVACLSKIMKPFSDVAFSILKKFGKEIGDYLEKNIVGIAWKYEICDSGDKEFCTINITIQDEYSKPAILSYTRLAKK